MVQWDHQDAFHEHTCAGHQEVPAGHVEGRGLFPADQTLSEQVQRECHMQVCLLLCYKFQATVRVTPAQVKKWGVQVLVTYFSKWSGLLLEGIEPFLEKSFH